MNRAVQMEQHDQVAAPRVRTGAICLMNDISVTIADFSDPATADALLALLRESYRNEAELVGYRDLSAFKATRKDLQDCRETFLLSRSGGRLAGFLSYTREGAWLNICRLAVSSAFLRWSVTSALLGRLMEQELEAALIRVDIGAANRPVLSCYRRLGFHVERRWATPDGMPMLTLIKA